MEFEHVSPSDDMEYFVFRSHLIDDLHAEHWPLVRARSSDATSYLWTIEIDSEEDLTVSAVSETDCSVERSLDEPHEWWNRRSTVHTTSAAIGSGWDSSDRYHEVQHRRWYDVAKMYSQCVAMPFASSDNDPCSWWRLVAHLRMRNVHRCDERLARIYFVWSRRITIAAGRRLAGAKMERSEREWASRIRYIGEDARASRLRRCLEGSNMEMCCWSHGRLRLTSFTSILKIVQ